MKLAIVVPGRFHAFDFAKALLKRGHDVTVFTNYPVWATRRFGLPSTSVRGFWLHGVLYRIIYKFSNSGLRWDTSGFLNPIFGRWAAAQVAKGSYDIVHSFSGVAAEILESTPQQSHLNGPLQQVVRGSAHILVQDALLREEEVRSKQRIERPCQTIIQREEREYQLADQIVTLSTFAHQSFLNQGISRKRLALLPLGVDVSAFTAGPGVLEARCRRILDGAPLRVLWVGTMSLQKGVMDYLEIVKSLASQNFQFRFVGTIPENTRPMADSIANFAEFIPRQEQRDLRPQYDWGDVFIFPTIQDGFAVVLAQAGANGLPILATRNCAGPDLLREDSTGWVLPIRSPQAFVERLRWCDQNRVALAAMVRRIGHEFVTRTWDDTALDFEKLCEDALRSLRGAGISQ